MKLQSTTLPARKNTNGASEDATGELSAQYKKPLAERAPEAKRMMLSMNGSLNKFHNILTAIQQTELAHRKELKSIEDKMQTEQALIRRLADHLGDAADHEVDCASIDEANAKIRGLQSHKVREAAELKQSSVEREDLEGLLSSHQDAVTEAILKFQERAQGQPEQKRHQPESRKRNAAGTIKATGSRPAISRTASGTHTKDVSASSDDSDIVPSSSRSASDDSGSDLL
ncbi:uncharacterized protein N0V89_008651 [Didymosphaeria variabile]|uniref:Uncharacterized protein n=1 Tax=Didymosphaeria variabile TaxID=1932322 RepID=A0A9W9C803_9PLEO|nr:uncharacterized protein N0V89_008651 [Didymosphaeria variabile]KAJ4350030.1 hypothetical protein N0V89_008651 [Didymosphaeria variabile]